MVDTTRMAVFGASGTGKTTYALAAAHKLDRLVAFDPEEEFARLPKVQAFEGARGMAGLLAALDDNWDGTFRLAFVPDPGREEQQLHEVARLLEALGEAYKAGRLDKTLTLVADELNLGYPVHAQPKYDGFARLCSRGRKRGIHIIGVSQRPAEVNTRFRNNANAGAFFGVTGGQEVDAVRGMTGDSALADKVASLPRKAFVAWSRDGGWQPRDPLPPKDLPPLN